MPWEFCEGYQRHQQDEHHFGDGNLQPSDSTRGGTGTSEGSRGSNPLHQSTSSILTNRTHSFWTRYSEYQSFSTIRLLGLKARHS